MQNFKHFATAKSIICSINTFENTLIPEAIYQENNLKKYLGFNFELDDKLSLASCHLSLLNAINVFQLPEYCQTITRIFPKCKFVHESGIQIELALRLSRLNQEDAAYLFFSDKFFRLNIVQNGVLQFCNTFHFQSEMDVAYYVLYVFDQLHIKPSSFSSYATGEIELNDATVQMLQDYIGPIKLLQTCELVKLQLDDEDYTVSHHFFTLFHQALCV